MKLPFLIGLSVLASCSSTVKTYELYGQEHVRLQSALELTFNAFNKACRTYGQFPNKEVRREKCIEASQSYIENEVMSIIRQ